MNPQELTQTVVSIIETTSNKIGVENDFNREMNSIGVSQTSSGIHKFDGTADTANKIHSHLIKLGYVHDDILGEYNKPVGKTFHVVKVSNKSVAHRFL